MATRKRRFGELSESARERAARSGERYGLTRRQVRERYNRGTYNPFARGNPGLRVPREFREYATDEGIDWAQAAHDNIYAKLHDYFKYNDDAVVYNVYTQANEDAQRLMAFASADELVAYARLQDVDGKPPYLPPGISPTDVGYYTNGKWNNIFWYH